MQPQQVDITITVFPLAGDAAALEGQPFTIQASADNAAAGPTCYGCLNRRGQLLLRNVAAGTYQAQLAPAADWLAGATDWLQQTLAVPLALLRDLVRFCLGGDGEHWRRSTTVDVLLDLHDAGLVASLCLELHPDGIGQFYPDPRAMAFLRRDEACQQAFAHAWDYAQT